MPRKKKIQEEQKEEKNLWWRPEKYKPEELEKKFDEYIEKCKEEKIDRWIAGKIDKPLTLSGFCIFIWVSKDYISEKAKNPKFSETIKKIRLIIENDVEEKALIWVYTPTASSFNLKNNFGWKEKIENETTLNWNLEINNILSSIKNKWLKGKS